MTKESPHARVMWRTIRLIARHWDKTHPFWWREDDVLDAAFSERDDVASRCWEQVIRQRIGI